LSKSKGTKKRDTKDQISFPPFPPSKVTPWEKKKKRGKGKARNSQWGKGEERGGGTGVCNETFVLFSSMCFYKGEKKKGSVGGGGGMFIFFHFEKKKRGGKEALNIIPENPANLT